MCLFVLVLVEMRSNYFLNLFLFECLCMLWYVTSHFSLWFNLFAFSWKLCDFNVFSWFSF